MRNMKWIGLLVSISLVIACFMPWVTIDSKSLVLSGVDTSGTTFGKPGYFHFFLVVFFIFCTFVQKVWAKRLNLLITALNIGWAVRNFFIIAGCSGGECPVRKAGIWIILLSSVLMLITALFPDMKLPAEEKR